MKKIWSYSCFFILAVVMFSSCKKSGVTPAPPAGGSASTPTAAYSGKPKYTGPDLGQYITFMDLSSSKTSEKKYFTIKLAYVGVKDSFEIVTQPQSVDSLGAGFPSEITTAPGFGQMNQWTNSQYRLLTSGGSSFYKDTIVRNPASNLYFLYQNYVSGGLKGEWPQSNFDNYYVPLGTNAQVRLHFRTIFYFKKGFCIDANNIEGGLNVKSISNFFIGAPNIYDWQNVDAAIQIVNFPVVPANPTNFYFFDFKNWRYFKWEQFNSNILNGALGTTFHGYESLDKFCKWPEGWGRK